MSEGMERQEAGPHTIRDAWAELKANPLRKAFPQLLLATYFWGVVVTPKSLRSPAHLTFLPLMLAGFAFYAIVIKRVFAALPRDRFFISYAFALPLFIGYTIWLGLALPVHRQDARERLGWVAMATGLVAYLILVVPSASGTH